jgi:hypothetical protein
VVLIVYGLIEATLLVFQFDSFSCYATVLRTKVQSSIGPEIIVFTTSFLKPLQVCFPLSINADYTQQILMMPLVDSFMLTLDGSFSKNLIKSKLLAKNSTLTTFWLILLLFGKIN